MEVVLNPRMEWYRKYAENYMDQILYQENAAEYILDRNYDLLYDFFCNVLERKEEYKILKARRCQVLFQIFAPIILKNEPDICVRGKFISDHAIAKYRNEILASSAVILDDILIHGRGLQELYDGLVSSDGNDNIHVYIHKMNREADSMEPELKAKIETDSVIFDWEWRELSTQLVNVIQATATPYVSTMGTYISKSRMNLDLAKDLFEIFDNANKEHRRGGTEAVVLFEKEPLPVLFRAWGYDACIRYYANAKMVKTAYVPYVFFSACSSADIDNFCSRMKACLDSRYDALRKELLLETDNKEQLKYKAYFVNILLNKMYGLYLEHKYPGVFDFSFPNMPSSATCVGTAVACDIEKLQYGDIQSLLSTDLGKEQCVEQNVEDAELLAGLKEAVTCEEEDNVLPLYFYYNRQLDERSAKAKEKRRKGLSTKAFYDHLNGEIHQKSRRQLKSWDSGIAACDKVVIDKFVYSCVKAGEQSFRYIVETLRSQGGNAVEWNSQEQKGNLRQRMLREFMENNSSRLCEWNVPLL